MLSSEPEAIPLILRSRLQLAWRHRGDGTLPIFTEKSSIPFASVVQETSPTTVMYLWYIILNLWQQRRMCRAGHFHQSFEFRSTWNGKQKVIIHQRHTAVSIIMNQEKMELRSSTNQIKSSQFICPALARNKPYFLTEIWTGSPELLSLCFSNRVSGFEENKHYEFVSSYSY